MAGKTKAAVQKAIKAMPKGPAKKEAKKMLDAAIGKSGKGKISQQELLSFQSKGIATNITHPKARGQELIGQAPPPPPILPFENYVPPPPPPVRVPERDVVQLVNESVDAATIQNLLFENIGANELTKFVRHDTVEGLNPYYNIISNLSDIKRKFDPANLVSLQKNDSSLFDLYAIKLQDKIPTDDYLQSNNLENYVYFDNSGNLVIELVNISDSELIEVEIDRNGTIYEIEET